MNEQPPVRKQTQVELYVEEVLPESSPVLRALPAGIDPKRFRNSLQIAIMMQPALLKCDPRLVFREVARAANYGISLDPSLGQGWLIVRKNRDGRPEPAFQLGYRGKMVLARQSGEVARIVAYPVTQKSVLEGRFRVTLDALHYEPDVFNDESPIVGYFAFIRYKDGTDDFETMSLREIHQIRDRSDGWRAFKKGSIRSTPWSEYEGEMAKKTVLSRLLKRVPMSADVVEFLREDEVADYTEVAAGDATPKIRQTRTEALRAIANQTGEPEAPRRGRPRKELPDLPDLPDLPQEESDGTPENESKTEAEQGVIDEEPVSGAPLDELEPPAFDRESKDYQRGAEDFAAGLKRCLSADIRAEPQRFENWKAGWQEAQEADEREDT